jgi:hypothetical protein
MNNFGRPGASGLAIIFLTWSALRLQKEQIMSFGFKVAAGRVRERESLNIEFLWESVPQGA